MHADHPRACGANFRPVSRGCSRFGSSPRVRGKRCKLRQLKQQIRIIPARAGQTNIESTLRYRRTDHPRACGANLFGFWVASRWDGSSPRVRGKLHRFPLRSFRVRIIPARAGQTDAYRIDDYEHPDHPRACGANGQHHTTPGSATGSSPRVRGKLDPAHVYALYRRIIPARAGQTGWFMLAGTVCPDHPRACGANRSASLCDAFQSGSSPRVRGKHVSCFTMRDCLRIIPARAGQTYVVMNTTGVDPDHPRACGANADNGQTVATRNGSSPRVRGKLARSAQVGHGVRIIPARAGQTSGNVALLNFNPDHPRACGANQGQRHAPAPTTGSSPRVRGKRSWGAVCSAPGRIIPARAGQTRRRPASGASTTDHPRACGANSGVFTLSADISGSSPRVRGKPTVCVPPTRTVRIIPARAGQTQTAFQNMEKGSDHPRACGANPSAGRCSRSRCGSSPRVRGKPAMRAVA